MNEKYLEMIQKEYLNAVLKHPEFCGLLHYHALPELRRRLFTIRYVNDEINNGNKAPAIASAILEEEVHEACIAYAEGNLDHALQELAQCGAVVLRMMEFVENKKRMVKK